MADVKEKGAPAPETTAVPSATPVNAATPSKKAPGLSFRRFFTKPGVSPYDEIEWEKRTALITDAKGNAIFEQKDVEVPKDWSVTATNIVASKYLHGTLGTPERESGVRALVTRVAETIRDWGMSQGYFKTPEDGATFHDELVAHPSAPVRRLQFAGVVQRRMRSHRARLRRPELALESGQRARRVRRHRLQDAAMLGLLHQLGKRLARFHPYSCQDRRHALQVGIRHRHQSFFAAFFH